MQIARRPSLSQPGIDAHDDALGLGPDERRPSIASVESIDPDGYKVRIDNDAKTEDTDGPNCCSCTGAHVDEEAVMSQAWWFCYCCCSGIGYLNAHAPCRLDTKCCCFRQICEVVEMETREGLCSCIQDCCFCSSLMQLPSPDGIPWCILCGCYYCGIQHKHEENEKKKDPTASTSSSDRHSVSSDPYTNFFHHIQEFLVPCFAVCIGCTCRPVFGNCYEGYCKCCCYRCSGRTTGPIDAGGCTCCSYLLNCGDIFAQGRLPARFADNPIMAIAGKKCKEKRHIASFSAPRQQEMR